MRIQWDGSSLVATQIIAAAARDGCSIGRTGEYLMLLGEPTRIDEHRTVLFEGDVAVRSDDGAWSFHRSDEA